MEKIIKNLLRTKNVHYYNGSKMDLDEDYIFDYCTKRDISFRSVCEELESLGYNLI